MQAQADYSRTAAHRRTGRVKIKVRMRFSEAFNPNSGELIVIDDPRDLDASLRLKHRLPSDLSVVEYLLQDRRLLGGRLAQPISTHSRVHAGGLYITRIVDRFPTEMTIGGAGLDRYWFAKVESGSMLVRQGGTATAGGGSAGVALRGHAGTSLLGSDDNVRTNLWIEADLIETALSEMLEDELRRPLEFHPAIDWSVGLAASLAGQMELFAAELARPDGVASNAIALASFRDLVVRTVLHGLRHNYVERLTPRPAAPAPVFLQRAEAFMRAYAEQTLRMADVAAAAGCSVRTLNNVYRHFRDTTPSKSLQAIRLQCLRDALQSGEDGSIPTLARRYGFTNGGRLVKAYSTRFRERPSETLRRGRGWTVSGWLERDGTGNPGSVR